MIRIRETPWENAAGTTTYTVAPDTVRANLMLMASGGTADLEESFGDHPDPNDANWSIVEFDPVPAPDPSTDAGKVRERLKALVDDGDDHQLIGVDGNVTMWSNGASVEESAAYALGDTLFYDTTDCRGNGRWVWTVDGDKDCGPPSIVLYHELAHGFLNHGSGDQATEEAEAVDEENVFRRAQGLKERDRDRLESECGCSTGGCCIIATVAAGSPTASTVQRLRRLRDHELRTTVIGHLLFDEIHEEYYAFSIDVARRLSVDRSAQDDVRELLVEPLLVAFELFAACRDEDDGEVAALLASVRSQVGSSPELVDRARILLDVIASPEAQPGVDDVSATTIEAARTIGRWLPRSPHLDWAVVDPVRILGELCLDRSASAAAAVRAYRAWIERAPLDAVIRRVPDPAAALREFAEHVLRDQHRRTALADRLLHRWLVTT